MTPYAVGFALAVVTFLSVRAAGWDRDGALYPVVLIVVATYYILFAAMSGTPSTMLAESLGAAVFAIAAFVGFRYSAWIVVAGLAGHGVFDFVHASLIIDPGVPPWWPAFCSSYDVGIAVILALQMWRTSTTASRQHAASRIDPR